MSARRIVPVLLAAVVSLVLAACGSSSSSGAAPPTASPAPSLASPEQTGRDLATEFMTILQQGDAEALDAFLAPGFQVQRADGTGATKSEYLAAPPVVKSFALGDKVVAVQQGDLLTVRWSTKAQESSSKGALGTADSPRMSVFVWQDGGWKLLAHSNFNPPA